MYKGKEKETISNGRLFFMSGYPDAMDKERGAALNYSGIG